MSWIHTHVILPLAEPERHKGLAARLRAIRRFERLPENAQCEEQQQRLRHILQHAYDTVPFYRQRFDQAGFRSGDARVDRPLPLPVLRRDDLRDAGDTLLSTAFTPADLRMASSSGTTSTPVTFHRNVEALRNKTALTMHLAASVGFHPGDPVLMLWGAHRDLALAPNWRWRLFDGFLIRRKLAPSGILSEEILERFRLRYESHRPKVLYCYASVLAAFAAHLQQTGFRHRPQVLITTAEVLSDQNRALIESVFQIPVHNFYGSRDIGMIGSECSEHAGPHFHPWASYVEFDPIGDTPDGPAYRLIVTDLLNHGQPFIRYDTGDCVTLAETQCRCGRWFPRARKIIGRVGDGLLLADGSMMPAVSLGNHISQVGHNFRAIAKMQFVQKTREHVHLRYVVNDGNASAQSELRTICNAIDALASQRMHWTLEEVHDIPREQSGKIRLCISEIPSTPRIFEKTV
jgi:phenylacetate-CoA ligase